MPCGTCRRAADDIIESKTLVETIENTIKIYPTILASGNGVNIQTSMPTDNLDIVIYDLQGKPVQTFNLRNVLAQVPIMLPLNPLSPNLYIIRAIGSNCSITQKISIQ